MNTDPYSDKCSLITLCQNMWNRKMVDETIATKEVGEWGRD